MTARVEKIGDATLILGDCRDVLPTLSGVDAVVTDPPYGIGFKYASHDDTPVGYGAWLWSIIERAESKCSPGSAIFIWQAMLNCRLWHEWFPRDYRIYAAAKNFVQMRSIAMQYAWDPVLVWWKEGERYRAPKMSRVKRDFFVADTASAILNANAIERQHPCPRPLDQVEEIIEGWVAYGKTVLDPFMGSGTVGVAAIRAGRRFVGIEKEPKYFDIACKRIRHEVERPNLFVNLPKEEFVAPSLFDTESTDGVQPVCTEGGPT